MERDYEELLPRLIDRLFADEGERNRVIELLQSYQDHEQARVRVGILRASRGRISEIERLLRKANADWRELLVEAEYPLSFGRETLRRNDPQKCRALEEEEAREYDDWLNQVLGQPAGTAIPRKQEPPPPLAPVAGSRRFAGADVRAALRVTLGSAPPGQRGGFVIFGGKRDLDYVQYCLDPNGLELNWPTGQEGGKERLPQIERYLKAKGYVSLPLARDGRSLAEQIQALRKGRYLVLDDGLYCQVGRDVEEIRGITLDLMKTVFGVATEAEIAVALEPNG